MSNTNLTIDMVTREALRIAHEKSAYLGTIDRQYDSSFANSGAKIGSTRFVSDSLTSLHAGLAQGLWMFKT